MSNVSSSNVSVPVLVAQTGLRQFKAGVKFGGQWVTGQGKQRRSAIKNLEAKLQVIGAPLPAQWLVKTREEWLGKPAAPAAPKYQPTTCYHFAVLASRQAKEAGGNVEKQQKEYKIAYCKAFLNGASDSSNPTTIAKAERFQQSLEKTGHWADVFE